jgi:hypothetical protein
MAMQVGDRVYVEGMGYGYLAACGTNQRHDWNVMVDGMGVYLGMYPARESELTLVEQVVVEGRYDCPCVGEPFFIGDTYLDSDWFEDQGIENGEEVRITIERKVVVK